MLRCCSDKLSHFTGKYFCLIERQSAFNNEETKRLFGCIPHSKNKNIKKSQMLFKRTMRLMLEK